ncbi:uncharacterized protein SETTUDRAFT_38739 [Exserohilum turcica Et28A]|uniref:Uncharacterized protein n=1 Tax=Exserohilum turcicum (strain 28A) TaxID=671987 RepID=R0KJ73_EXST2|nr:uncharacterized protein SETTUDRAFT_38739 [Exserohilum turcica Et28A]EOA88052.1 hypothetical protein SETTUDRAFT_38739 [Exserohilum turcica Et28A]
MACFLAGRRVALRAFGGLLQRESLHKPWGVNPGYLYNAPDDRDSSFLTQAQMSSIKTVEFAEWLGTSRAAWHWPVKLHVASALAAQSGPVLMLRHRSNKAWQKLDFGDDDAPCKRLASVAGEDDALFAGPKCTTTMGRGGFVLLSDAAAAQPPPDSE